MKIEWAITLMAGAYTGSFGKYITCYNIAQIFGSDPSSFGGVTMLESFFTMYLNSN